jgi:predicted KAP-like P-loop ATPase
MSFWSRFKVWGGGAARASDDSASESQPVDTGSGESASGSKLSADEPIHTRGEDRLDRTRFAAIIAAEIAASPRTGGFVLAVTGPWGGGKTSVINMAVEFLEEQQSAVILNFNPWLFSGTEQLVEHFFRELATQLGETDDDRLQRIGAQLSTYGRIAGPILRAVPVVGGGLELASTMVHGAGEAVKGAEESVHSRREKLRKALANLDCPIAVVVDDIDRLHSDEVAHVVRLVRLVGDFPNVVYVLAFDRTRLERALGGSTDSESVHAGREYLEKIVQLSHEVPEPDPTQLTKLLQEAIGSAVGDPTNLYFDRAAFTNIFVAWIRPLVSTLRDVNRFANTLPSTVALVGDEIALADILALEALKTFMPDTYGLVINSKDALTSPSPSVGYGSTTQEQGYKADIERIMASSDTHQRDLGEFLRRTFPAAGRHLPQGSHYGSEWLATWRREHRVAHPEVFEIYLTKTLPTGVLPSREVEAVFEALEDKERLEGLLAELDADKIEAMLERLEHYKADFPKEHPETPIIVMLNLHHILSASQRSVFDIGAGVKLDRVVLRLLRDLDETDVERVVTAAIPEIGSLGARASLVTMVGSREGAGQNLVSSSDGIRLEAALVLDILDADLDALSQERDLAYLLSRARDWDEEATTKKIRELIADDARLVRLLRAVTIESVGGPIGDYAQSRSIYLHWPTLVSWIGEDEVIDRIKSLPDEIPIELDERGVVALERARAYAENPELVAKDLQRFDQGDD